MNNTQLTRARGLIARKRYGEARATLQGLNHPTAIQWLAKLDRIAPVRAARPEDRHALDRMIMDGCFDEVQAITLASNQPELWPMLDRTRPGRWRELKHRWLGYYRLTFNGNPEEMESWRCTCGRLLVETPLCPNKGGYGCRMRLDTRPIREPDVLAQALEAYYRHDLPETGRILSGVDDDLLRHWQDELKRDLSRIPPDDVRYATLQDVFQWIERLPGKQPGSSHGDPGVSTGENANLWG